MGKSFNPILQGSAPFIAGAGGFPDSATPSEASLDLSLGPGSVVFSNTNADSVGGVLLATLSGVDADKFRLTPPSVLQGYDFAAIVPPSGVKTRITFDPERIQLDTSLSSDLKEWTNTVNDWRSAIVGLSLTSGKWYWEVERVSATSTSGVIGIGRISQVTDTLVGGDNYGWANTTGSVGGFAASYHAGAVLDASYMAYWRDDGDVVMLAYDADNGLFWMGVNGAWGGGAVIAEIESADGSNTLASDVPSGLAPIVSSHNGQTFRLRSEAAELSYAIPSGFQALEEYSFTTLQVTRIGGAAGATLSASIDVVSSEGEYSIPITSTLPALPTYEALIVTTGTEGQEITLDTGAVYVWRDAISYWLRKEMDNFADADLALIKELPGDTDPTVEGWTKGGTGAVYSNGVDVVWDAAPGGGAYTEFTYPVVSGRWALQGNFIVDFTPTVSTSNTYCNSLRNWSKRIDFCLWEFDSGFARLTSGYGTTDVGSVNANVDFVGNRHFVEIAHDGSTVYVWFDNEATPSLTASYSSFATDGGSGFSLGQRVGTASPDYDYQQRGRDIRVFRLT